MSSYCNDCLKLSHEISEYGTGWGHFNQAVPNDHHLDHKKWHIVISTLNAIERKLFVGCSYGRTAGCAVQPEVSWDSPNI